MSFSERFLPFVCEGDTITCTVEGFEITARIVRDDCLDPPDQRQDGFWPSLEIGDAGFIGPGNSFRQRFDEAQKRAEAVMTAWKAGDWFYCGVVLSVAFEEVELGRNFAALWGVEANYPGNDSASLTEVALELLPQALEGARAALVRLMDHALPTIPRVEIIVSGGVVQDVIVTGGKAEIIIDDRDNAS